MRTIKRLLWALVVLLVALGGVYAWSRLRPPTPTQEKALAQLHENLRPVKGSNAFPRLWFVDFAVPGDQLDAEYAKAIVEARALMSRPLKEVLQVQTIPDLPSSGFPALPKLGDAERHALCGLGDGDCLAKVRANKDVIREALTAHADRLARDQALAGDAYAWDERPFSPALGLPSFTPSLGLWQSAIALDFVDDHQAQAMESACTQVSTMRRLQAHSNTLLTTMMLGARMIAGTRLFVQMLSELPPDAALPETCRAAFAPVVAEDVDLCPAVEGEFAFFEGAMDSDMGNTGWDALLLNKRAVIRTMATRYAQFCGATLAQKLLSDEPVYVVPPIPVLNVLDKSGQGDLWQMVQQQGMPGFNPYLADKQDVAATLRVGALMMWLRDAHADGTPLVQRLAQRPAWMVFAPGRQIAVAPDGHSLHMQWYHKERKLPENWPLP